VAVLRWCGLAHPVTLVLLAILGEAGIPSVLLGVVAAAAAALAGPSSAVVLSGVMTLIGGVGLSRNRAITAVRPHPDRVHALVGPLSSPAVLALLLTITWVGVGFGAVEIAMPAFAEAHGSPPAAAGVLLAVWSLGSIAGGLVYGGLATSRPVTQQLPLLITLFAITASLPLLARSPVTMALALFGYGLTVAPFFACNSVLLGSSAPPGTTTEAFAWNASMIFGGAAIGTAVAGSLAQSRGPTAALAVTAVAGVLALATSLSGRRRLSVG
jgi:predicted MFS family arabinose efflux permease